MPTRPDTITDPTRLLHVAYRAAARIVHNQVLAEEAGERAVHRFQLAVMAGQAPDKPEAWVRTVARHSACAILRNGWARTQPIPEESWTAAAHVAEGPGDDAPNPVSLGDHLRTVLATALTPRQLDALDAALTCRTTRDAARACGMEPRDFRRYLAAISRRARRKFAIVLVDARRRASVLDRLPAG